MTHYYTVPTTKEIKDALYYRGAIASSINAKAGAFGETLSTFGDTIGPNAVITGLPNFPQDLGIGISCTVAESTNPDKLDHAVLLVGWGPCKVCLIINIYSM